MTPLVAESRLGAIVRKNLAEPLSVAGPNDVKNFSGHMHPIKVSQPEGLAPGSSGARPRARVREETGPSIFGNNVRTSPRGIPVTSTTVIELYVFMLAAFVGYQIISRVPPLLHTPLMSATNAISAISLVGSLVAAGADYNQVSTILGVIAVASATTNAVGGFMITDRMLRMFKRDERPTPAKKDSAGGEKAR